jgi:hypothetical protein
MMRRTEASWQRESPEPVVIGPDRLKLLRSKLENKDYMKDAIQRLAQELSIEIMEDTYGIPFR